MSGREPEERVGVPLLYQAWCAVSFLHWRYEPAAVQLLLPPGLEVDEFDGYAWVSMTPFLVEHARPPFVPPIPGLSTFPETNVRTYVKGPDGRDGLWFLTLEADSLLTVASARTALGLPYERADMDVELSDGEATYRSCRRAAPEIAHRITVAPNESFVDRNDQLAHWLTGRWRAWTIVAGRFASVPVQHEPWLLRSARVIELEENLLASVGLEAPSSGPVVHFAVGANATLGWPSLTAARAPRRPPKELLGLQEWQQQHQRDRHQRRHDQ